DGRRDGRTRTPTGTRNPHRRRRRAVRAHRMNPNPDGAPHRAAPPPTPRSRPPMRTDLILLSARLLDPGTGRFLPHTALAAADGRISDLGDDRRIRALAGPATTVIDMKGAVVTPGLVDGHSHPFSGAEGTRGVDLSGCTDLEAVRAALAAGIRCLGRGAWLRGWGLEPKAFGARPVVADAIGLVLAGVTAALRRFDVHSMLASRRALELAGVDGPRVFAQAAEVVCDDDGRPTGLLLEEAAGALVEAAAPAPTSAELRAQTAAVLQGMAAAGLTGAHVMDGEGLEVYAGLEAEGALTQRLRIAPWCRPGDGPGALRKLVGEQSRGGRLWRVAGVKLFMDGTIDNGTAWLEIPDSRGESTRPFWPDPAAYTRAVTELHR